MARRIVRRTSAQVRAELELLEALEPIEQAHLDAKAAYKAAVASGDRAAIKAAKQRKRETGDRLNEVREWLRREQVIRKLQTVTVPELERRAASGTDKQRREAEAVLERARAELKTLADQAAAYRAALEQLGGVVTGEPVPADLPPGSADVSMPAVAVKAKAAATGSRKRGA